MYSSFNAKVQLRWQKSVVSWEILRKYYIIENMQKRYFLQTVDFSINALKKKEETLDLFKCYS